MYEFISRGLLEPNVERVVGLLKERRDAMLGAFERELPEGTAWSRPEGGYFTWLDFPEGTDAAALLAAATERGVTFVKGSDFYPRPRAGRRQLGLPSASSRPTRSRRASRLLAGALGELRAPPVAV